MALALLVVSFSYSYSEIVTGVTNNAAGQGYSWQMNTLLPGQGGLVVNGIIYGYTVTKNAPDDYTVTIRNEDAVNNGYIFEQTDDWSGVPGNTLARSIALPPTEAERWGLGEIVTEGTGELSNTSVRYNYQFDPCYIVLSNPECPGYAEALLDYLKNKGLLDYEEDPLLREYMQSLLDDEVELKEEDKEEEKEEEEDSLEDRLALAENVNKVANEVQQQAMLAALQVNVINSYYEVNIKGGEYKDVLQFERKEISDNKAAARVGLAQQKLHTDMVNMQYNN